MANVLCQIRGERRLILFPPDDVQHLQMPAGTSTSTISIFQEDDGPHIPRRTHPHETRLKPGEILFIPPLWPHTASPATTEVTVAVNVFFRNLSPGRYAMGRDVYGNRDLKAYEKARNDLRRMTRTFTDGLPPEMARFYLLRLAQELQDEASSVVT